jgi:Asp-tRNA(Asn)/Glu-tRNA(Gln) amidotransferase B subunit
MSHEAMQHFDLVSVAREVLEEHPDEVATYRRGGPTLGFLLGRVMKRLSDEQPHPYLRRISDVQDALREALAE